MAKQVPRKEDMVTRIKKCLTQDISRFDDPRLEFGSLYEGKPQLIFFRSFFPLASRLNANSF